VTQRTQGSTFDIEPLFDQPYASRQFVQFVDHVPEAEGGVDYMQVIEKLAPSLGLYGLIYSVGSAAIRSLKEAKDHGVDIIPVPWIASDSLTLPPGHPRKDVLYIGHPTDAKRYLPAADFHRLIFEHKFAEATRMLMHLGAKTIEVRHSKGWDESFAANVSAGIPRADAEIQGNAGKEKSQRKKLLYKADFEGHDDPSLPLDLAWFNHEPTWKNIAEGRIKFGMKKFSLKLQYVDDYEVNADLTTNITKAGLSLGGSFSEHEKTVWTMEGTFG
jgi:hypothetical protein